MKKSYLIFSTLLILSAMHNATAWSSWSSWSQYPQGPQNYQQWNSNSQLSSGFQIQHFSALDGYHIRIASMGRNADQINIQVEGRRITISSLKVQQDHSGGVRIMQSGHFSQWIDLPMDADMQSMRRRQSLGMIEIFVPRIR
ncbi:MAG: Hsp20/alpha crystallin family protein [Pseudomonadota bacterium]|nr:Hsp20/alpha crystallin family protein [Pseudomonadota bacterium]